LIRPSAVWGAAGALGLLLVFMLGVARAMSQGRAPDCHCFGQIHSEPAGPSTLIRNAVLAAPAILILVGGTGPSLNGGLGSLNGTQAALVATAVVAAVLAVAVLQLWQDKRRLSRSLDAVIRGRQPGGLPLGTPAPAFELVAVRGEGGSLSELIDKGRSVVLVFVSTACGPCLEMLPLLAGWQQSLSASLTVAAIFAGEPAEIERLVEEHGLELALAQHLDEVFELYRMRATPSGVLIRPDGTIAVAAAEGGVGIEALIRSALAQDAAPELVIHSG
jgi:thiol-disulfide isomerase/thioredoxin